MADSDRTESASEPERSALDTVLDASDPLAREEQTFPHLSAEMLARVARYGSEERFARQRIARIERALVEVARALGAHAFGHPRSLRARACRDGG